MAIELTTATTAQVSGIGQTLGIGTSYVNLLFPDAILSIDSFGIPSAASASIADFKFFSKYKSFANLAYKGITTIQNANFLVNLENVGTANALALTGNSLTAGAINALFTALPSTTKTATINVAGNPGAATCDTSIATNKGYTVITS